MPRSHTATRGDLLGLGQRHTSETASKALSRNEFKASLRIVRLKYFTNIIIPF